MTERLYYRDSYLREFEARVLQRSEDGCVLYLERTAFYPDSGGQPADSGFLSGVPVVDVAEEGDRIAHRTAHALMGDQVTGQIDWVRRFDHMQQHSGQHLLSAVFIELFDAQTVSFHLGPETSTIDLAVPALSPEQVRTAQLRANEVVFENRPLAVTFESAEQAADLRKPAEREGVLRVISIAGLDRSACGGTHVRATGEIGCILIRRLDKIRGTVRVEFLCGRRATGRARADYDALARIARLFSTAIDDAPAQVAAQLEAARTLDKQRRKLEADLAAYHGRELYASTPPDPEGFRRVVRRAAAGSPDEMRARRP
jgi:alanyl-tRNA synthetase